MVARCAALPYPFMGKVPRRGGWGNQSEPPISGCERFGGLGLADADADADAEFWALGLADADAVFGWDNQSVPRVLRRRGVGVSGC